MLHVGPKSAGAVPGPACLWPGRHAADRDGRRARARLSSIPIFSSAARCGWTRKRPRPRSRGDVAAPLGLDVDAAAAAIVAVATENMVQAILDITVNQGIDPREAVLVGGGGAAGLNSVLIARRLESPRLLIPEVGAALVGGRRADVRPDRAIPRDAVHAAAPLRFSRRQCRACDASRRRCQDFIDGPGKDALSRPISFWAEARYPEQVWEIEVPLPSGEHCDGRGMLLRLVAALSMRTHEESSPFATRPHRSRSSAGRRGRLPHPREHSGALAATSVAAPAQGAQPASRISRGTAGSTPGASVRGDCSRRDRSLARRSSRSSFTTVVVHPGAVATRRPRAVCRSIPVGAQHEGSNAAKQVEAQRDGVRLALINNRLEGVARKMANTLLRTGRSGVLNIARDFSCCIVTRRRRAARGGGKPADPCAVGPGSHGARRCKQFHPVLQRGDAFLHNSPYHGCSHPADHTLLVPVIDDAGRHRFTVLAKAHQADCGNSSRPPTWARARRVRRGRADIPRRPGAEELRDRSTTSSACASCASACRSSGGATFSR